MKLVGDVVITELERETVTLNAQQTYFYEGENFTPVEPVTSESVLGIITTSGWNYNDLYSEGDLPNGATINQLKGLLFQNFSQLNSSIGTSWVPRSLTNVRVDRRVGLITAAVSFSLSNRQHPLWSIPMNIHQDRFDKGVGVDIGRSRFKINDETDAGQKIVLELNVSSTHRKDIPPEEETELQINLNTGFTHAEGQKIILTSQEGGWYYLETDIPNFSSVTTFMPDFIVEYNNTSRASEQIRLALQVTGIEIIPCDCPCSSDGGSLGNARASLQDETPKMTIETGSGIYEVNISPSSLTDPSQATFFNSLINAPEQLFNGTVLHQIKNDVGLTQIDILTPDSYSISQYNSIDVGPKDGNGFYTVTGNPRSVFVFSKLSDGSLEIEEKKGNTALSFAKYVYNTTGAYWTLYRDVNGDGIYDSYEYTTGSNTLKTSYVYKGTGELVSKIERTYDSSNRLRQEVVDPDTKALTTIYTYTGHNLTRVDYPDGSWETTTYTADNDPELITYSSGKFIKYEYDSTKKISKSIESFNGSAYSTSESEHKVTEYGYSPVVSGDDGSVEPNEVRLVSVKILGNPISKTCYGYLPGETVTIQAATPTSTVSHPDNSVFRTFTNSEGEVIKEINPEGTGTIIDTVEDGTSTTITTDSGVLSGDLSSVISGTSIVQILENDLEVSTSVFDISTGLLISSRTVTSRDGRDRETRVDYHDGTYETFVYDCCNLDESSSRDGVVTSYTYDALGRRKTSTSNGVTTTNFYDAAGNTVKLTETGTDGTTRTLSESYYNVAGQLEWTKDAEGHQTTYATTYPGNGTTVEIVTYPNSKTRITTSDSEGNVLSVGGTGAFAETADIDEESVEFDATLGYHVLAQKYGKADNWTKTYTDAPGRTYKTETSTGAVSTDYFNTTGELTKSVAANGATTLYYNDPVSNLSIQALDVNKNNLIDYGIDVVTRSQSEYIEENSVVYQRTRSWINPDSLASPGAEDNIRKVSNDGLLIVNTSTANGITSTLRIITEIDVDGSITTTSMAPDGTSTETRVVAGLQEWVKNYDDNSILKSTITYGYDNFNRLKTQTDSRNGTTTYTYDNSDRVRILKTPDPDATGPDAFQEFKTFYTNMGQRDYVVHPDGSQINFTYNDQGLIKNATGSQVYPRTYYYDGKGNLTSLTTSGQSGNSVLSWQYYDNGQLHKKVDHLNREVSYTYYPGGQIQTKTNARGIVKTWIYDDSGRLDSVTYSDGTPGYSFTYNELGRLDTISDALGDRKLHYNTLGQYTGFTKLSGVLSGLSQTYSYDLNGRQSTAGLTLGSITRSNTYLYNEFGLLETVDDGKNKYEYSYLDQSPYTVETLEVEQNGTVQIHSKRAFDFLMRTTGFEWKMGAVE